MDTNHDRTDIEGKHIYDVDCENDHFATSRDGGTRVSYVEVVTPSINNAAVEYSEMNAISRSRATSQNLVENVYFQTGRDVERLLKHKS